MVQRPAVVDRALALGEDRGLVPAAKGLGRDVGHVRRDQVDVDELPALGARQRDGFGRGANGVDGLLGAPRERVVRVEPAVEPAGPREDGSLHDRLRRVARAGEQLGERVQRIGQSGVERAQAMALLLEAGEEACDRGQRPGALGVCVREAQPFLREGVEARGGLARVAVARQVVGGDRVGDENDDGGTGRPRTASRRRAIGSGWVDGSGRTGGEREQGQRAGGSASHAQGALLGALLRALLRTRAGRLCCARAPRSLSTS